MLTINEGVLGGETIADGLLDGKLLSLGRRDSLADVKGLLGMVVALLIKREGALSLRLKEGLVVEVSVSLRGMGTEASLELVRLIIKEGELDELSLSIKVAEGYALSLEEDVAE